MALAGRILDQDDVAGGDKPALAVAGGYLHARIEIDDVLPARRRVPIDIVLGLGLAKDHAGRRKPLRQLATAPRFDPLDLDVAEMRFAVFVGVEIVDPHRSSPSIPP